MPLWVSLQPFPQFGSGSYGAGNGVNIHLVDDCARVFCEYLADEGALGYTWHENPDRFLPKLKEMGLSRVKAYIC